MSRQHFKCTFGEIMKELVDTVGLMQRNIVAQKDRFNSHGKFKYRSVEDVLGSIKQVLPAGHCISMNDEVIMIGDRFYIKATASITNGNASLSASAFAREALEQKGMCAGQLSGSTSSYARKYALCALFAIDDSELQPVVDMDSGTPQDLQEPIEKSLEKIAALIAAETDINSLRNLYSSLVNSSAYRALSPEIEEMAKARAAALAPVIEKEEPINE